MTVAEARSWEQLDRDERRARRIDRWSSAPGVEFATSETEATFRAAVERFRNVVELKKLPDRVPILLMGTFMPADLFNVSAYELMYDVDVLTSTFRKLLVDYEPDYYLAPEPIGSGQVFDLLDYRHASWAGHGLPRNQSYQYHEGEYMHEDEYRQLIDDPSDFWIRTYFPRAFGALEGLQLIPAFTDFYEPVLVTGHMVPFGRPEVQAALQTLLEAGRIAFAWAEQVGRLGTEAMSLGYPKFAGGMSKAPFDIVADTLRGTRASMIDMRRRPDMLLEAVDRMTPIAVKQGVRAADSSGNPIVFMPLHKGADGFMSDRHFQEFYWPSLKAVVEGLVDEGCIPFLFVEGGYDTRLEYLQELPPGTTFCLFDKTDMVRAKQMLEGRVAIGGNVPGSMLLTGTADDVRGYCKELLEKVAPGGGYIMSFGTAMDEGKPETVHAMIDYTKEHGVYR